MALIKCKECGNEISSKAETCPKCGLRFKASSKPNAGSGCIVGFGKLIGGIVGLVLAISFLSNNSVPPIRQLEIRCEEASKTQSNESEKNAFYTNCVAAGSSQIRAQERINQEQSTESNSKITEKNQPLPSSNEPVQPEEILKEYPVAMPEVTPNETTLPTSVDSSIEASGQSK